MMYSDIAETVYENFQNGFYSQTFAEYRNGDVFNRFIWWLFEQI